MSLKIIKLDGGSGMEAVELFDEEFQLHSHKCWSSKLLFENKNLVASIHDRFIKSGSDVITTLSYQADPISLSESFNLSREESEGIMYESVNIAKVCSSKAYNKKDNRILVAASVGCYGTHLADGSEYNGDYIDKVPQQDILDLFQYRLKCLLTAEPDFIAFETIPTLAEVKLICQLMREYPNVKSWLSVCCPGHHSQSNPMKLAHGELLEDAVKTVAKSSSNLFGMGINCSADLFSVNKAIEIMRCGLDKQRSILVYPNSGELWNRDNNDWFYPPNVSDSTFEELVPQWLKSGANWIGGCCRMNSTKMNGIYDIIDKWMAKTLHKINC